MACYRIFGHGGEDVTIETGMPGTPVRVWTGEEWESTPRSSEEAWSDADKIRIGLEFAFGTESDLEEGIARAKIEPCDDPSKVDITDEQIEALRREAIEAGDEDQVALCDRALEGDVDAQRECAKVIAYAKAEAAGDE